MGCSADWGWGCGTQLDGFHLEWGRNWSGGKADLEIPTPSCPFRLALQDDLGEDGCGTQGLHEGSLSLAGPGLAF
jgi:hypothetical protein